jgi:hypothetical protein
MKRKLNIRHLLFLLVFFITISKTHAQSRQPYLPDSGFYVLINNKNNMNETKLQFYNDDQQLIYQEIIYNKKLNLRRKKVLRCLNLCLTKAMLAWNDKKEVLQNKGWLADILNN